MDLGADGQRRTGAEHVRVHRVELPRALELRQRLVVPARLHQLQGEDGARPRVQRVERDAAQARIHGLVDPSGNVQLIPEVVPGVRVVRIQLHRPPQRALAARPIPLVEEPQDPECDVRLTELRVQLERPRHRGAHLRHALLLRHMAEVDARPQDVGLLGPRQREARFQLDRPVEELHRRAHRIRAQVVAEVPGSKVQIVRREIRRPLRSCRGAARRQAELERARDRPRDLILHRDDVRHLPVVLARPDVIA